MRLMAKKKPSPAAAAPDRHKSTVVSFRPDAALRGVLQSVADKQRRSVAQVVILLLEQALTVDGLWPPAGDQKGGK